MPFCEMMTCGHADAAVAFFFDDRKQTMNLDLHASLASLARTRSVFHSEADFQHSLAWQIHLADPNTQLRLETRSARNIRLDILVTAAGQRTAIELKYLVAAFQGDVGNEQYDLPNQAAHDISRHDVVKDISRVEAIVAAGTVNVGWAVALTNDPSYWQPGRKLDPIDAEFRLHEGRVLEGSLGWAATAGSGTTRKRQERLVLQGRYECCWRDYAIVKDSSGRSHRWRYLAFRVPDERPLTSAASTTHKAAAIEMRTSSPDRVTPKGTARDEILAAVRTVVAASPDHTFAITDVIAELRRRGSTYTDSTIRTHVSSRMCVNAPQHHGLVYPDLERVGAARYRLRVPRRPESS